MQKLGEVVIDGARLRVMRTRYEAGPTAILLQDEQGQRYATVSVNIDDPSRLQAEQFWAKTWSENEPLREPLLASGLFEDTGERAQVGFVVAELWRLKAA